MNGIQEIQTCEGALIVNPTIGIEKKKPRIRSEKTKESDKRYRANHRERENELALKRYHANREKIIMQRREWFAKNKDKAKNTRVLWEAKNRKKINEKNRQRNLKNVDRIRKYQREWNKNNPEKSKEYHKRSAEKNPDRFREMQRRADAKKRATIKGRLSNYISRAIRRSLGNGGKYNRHWELLVDFSLDQLKKHLEKNFLSGMTWKNRNEWHIDHIIPISAFNFMTSEDIDFKRCWSLKNLHPLWATENIRKKNKLQKPFQPALILH